METLVGPYGVIIAQVFRIREQCYSILSIYLFYEKAISGLHGLRKGGKLSIAHEIIM